MPAVFLGPKERPYVFTAPLLAPDAESPLLPVERDLSLQEAQVGRLDFQLVAAGSYQCIWFLQLLSHTKPLLGSLLHIAERVATPAPASAQAILRQLTENTDSDHSGSGSDDERAERATITPTKNPTNPPLSSPRSTAPSTFAVLASKGASEEANKDCEVALRLPHAVVAANVDDLPNLAPASKKGLTPAQRRWAKKLKKLQAQGTDEAVPNANHTGYGRQAQPAKSAQSKKKKGPYVSRRKMTRQ
jgi:hypothetical protein